MQANTVYETESATTATIDGEEELPAGLPADVVEAITRLHRLDKQADVIRRCVESLRATAHSVLTRR